MKQEVTYVLNSKEEEQLVNETMDSRMLQLFEENAQLKNELRASKDEQIKFMQTIGELYWEKAQLKEQLTVAKETNKEQSNRINQLEEERSHQQQEMYSIKLSTQQQQLDNATKQNEVNDINKQLCQAKEELKEAQEKHAKAEKEIRQRHMELYNRMKEVEQQKEELDNRKEELDTQEQYLDEEKKKEVAKLNTRIEEHSTKQREYDEVIDVLLQALVDSGKQAKYVIEEASRNADGFYSFEWQDMRKHLIMSYNDIWKYLNYSLTNNVSKEKDLMGIIDPNIPFFKFKY